MAFVKGLGTNNGNWKQNNNNNNALETVNLFPEEVTNIIYVSAVYDHYICFLSSDDKLYQSNPNSFQSKLKAFENLPPMKCVDSGFYHFFSISDEEIPKVYGWGRNGYHQIGLNNNNTTRVDKPTLVQALKDKKIGSVHPSGYSSLVLSSEDQIVYGCGQNSSGELGIISTNQNAMIKLHENVVKVFSGHSEHSFIIKTDGEIYAFGYNQGGQYGNGTILTQDTPQKVKLEFAAEEISKMVSGYKMTALVTTDGFYLCLKIIKNIAAGYGYLVYLTEDNEIWTGGNFNNNNSLKKITNLSENELSFNTLRCCDFSTFFLFRSETNSYLSQDLGKLLENGHFSDCKIKNIPVHKLLIEARLDHDFDEISKYLEESCQLKDIENLLQWIYCDEIRNQKKTIEILNHFGIQKPQKNETFKKNDLRKLLFDEETSDFTLVVQNDENEDDNEDYDEEDIEEEELAVHKFILAARSGLFLDLFQNLDKNLKKVKDYSKKIIRYN
ncbi:regulator of chromosome condensation [Anaeramoeba flamelloides]|uniref:Regulator of chromosome condensation n=1 Tax=Anaeramoeba flamelloides TaxID=1746091 RepID=A0AAV8ACC0_9EUKA|nr:regulator of chromosome condensation [Anaeramoeba flamelloides]